jgi:hypothetical protein
MAYFNHAFQKMFMGNRPGTQAESGTTAGVEHGFLTTSGISTVELANTNATVAEPFGLGPGVFGMFNSETYQSLAEGDLAPGECCPLILAAASLKASDKQGPFHGGYQESTKSKYIKPQYVREFYRVDPNEPQANVVHVGQTQVFDCLKEFFCGETYYLRVEVKGSPALRFANHNLYQTLQADGGCCSGPVPATVDPTLIYIQWAEAILENPYLKDFINPVVIAADGLPLFATEAEATAYGDSTRTFANWPIAPYTYTPGDLAGMILTGAYVDTTFGNCSFQNTDHFEKEPIRILVSEVDYNGDPCVFEGVCVNEECPSLQGMGYGEQVIRDLIMSESYLQNFFHTDIRIREITQGDSMFNVGGVDLRSSLFTRFYILHSVPRYNNPTGVFDNDQYMLCVVTEDLSAAGANVAFGTSAFESFMDTWLTNCGDQCTTEVDRSAVSTCTPAALPTP